MLRHLALALAVAALVGVPASVTRATTLTGGDRAPLVAHHGQHCKTGPLRRAIVDRRAATWRWQRELGRETVLMTTYPERWARGCAYLRWVAALWARRADDLYRYWLRLSDPVRAILYVFGPTYGQQAVRVAWCESRHSVWATNGQYLGLFQMGSSERATYGHGSTALAQARAAHAYFMASGRDWSPWSCQPW